MPMTTFREFCDSVLSAIPRATGGEREAIRAELLDHLSDHREMLVEHGMEELEAERRAIEAMGDPTEIGRAWNEKLSPFWLWLGRLCCVGFVLILLFSSGNILGTADNILESIVARRNPGIYVSEREVTGYELIWENEPTMEKPFGEHIIRIERVELYESRIEKDYIAQIYYVTWHQDVFGKALDSKVFRWEEKYGPGVTYMGGGSGWGGYVSYAREKLAVDKGLEAIEISFDYNGNHFEAVIPLDWGGASA